MFKRCFMEDKFKPLLSGHKMPTSNFYTPNQALVIALTFSVIDIGTNILGLAWNGEFFTFDNISYWFNFRDYKFTENPVDFLLERVFFKLGGIQFDILGILYNPVVFVFGRCFGIFCKPRNAAEACAKYS